MTIEFSIIWKIWGFGFAVGFQDEAGAVIILGPIHIELEKK